MEVALNNSELSKLRFREIVDLPPKVHKNTTDQRVSVPPSEVLEIKFGFNTSLQIRSLVHHYFGEKYSETIFSTLCQTNSCKSLYKLKYLNNWRMKKFCSDLSYLRDACGYPRMYYFDYKVNPSTFFQSEILPNCFDEQVLRKQKIINAVANYDVVGKKFLCPREAIVHRQKLNLMIAEKCKNADYIKEAKKVRRVVVSKLPILNDCYKRALIKAPKQNSQQSLGFVEEKNEKNMKEILYRIKNEGRRFHSDRSRTALLEDVGRNRKRLNKLKNMLNTICDQGFEEPKTTVKVHTFREPVLGEGITLSNAYATLGLIEEKLDFANSLFSDEDKKYNLYKQEIAKRELIVKKHAKISKLVVRHQDPKIIYGDHDELYSKMNVSKKYKKFKKFKGKKKDYNDDNEDKDSGLAWYIYGNIDERSEKFAKKKKNKTTRKKLKKKMNAQVREKSVKLEKLESSIGKPANDKAKQKDEEYKELLKKSELNHEFLFTRNINVKPVRLSLIKSKYFRYKYSKAPVEDVIIDYPDIHELKLKLCVSFLDEFPVEWLKFNDYDFPPTREEIKLSKKNRRTNEQKYADDIMMEMYIQHMSRGSDGKEVFHFPF